MAQVNSRRAFLRDSGAVLAGAVVAPLAPGLASHSDETAQLAALSDVIPDVLDEDSTNAVFGALTERNDGQLRLQRKTSGPVTLLLQPGTRYWRDRFATVDALELGDNILAWGDAAWHGGDYYRASTIVATPQYIVINVTHSSGDRLNSAGLQVDLTRIGRPISSGPVSYLPGAPSVRPIEPSKIRAGYTLLILGRKSNKTHFQAHRIGRLVQEISE